MAEKLTEVQIKAKALMATMIPNGHYRAKDLETANAMVTEMIINGECEKADGIRACGWLGNASAVDQWGRKMGFIKASDVDRDATARALDTLIAAAKATAAKK
jgi:hypothetical protein